MEGFKEWLAIKLAWLLPERLVMWCAYRVAAHATSGKWDTEWVPGLTFMDAIGRWGLSNERPDRDRSRNGGDAASGSVHESAGRRHRHNSIATQR